MATSNDRAPLHHNCERTVDDSLLHCRHLPSRIAHNAPHELPWTLSAVTTNGLFTDSTSASYVRLS